jgi:hypothetical protein
VCGLREVCARACCEARLCYAICSTAGYEVKRGAMQSPFRVQTMVFIYTAKVLAPRWASLQSSTLGDGAMGILEEADCLRLVWTMHMAAFVTTLE